MRVNRLPRLTLLTLSIAVLALTACGSRKPGSTDSSSVVAAASASPRSTPRASASPEASTGSSISFESIANGTSRIKTAGTRSVTDAAGYETLWQEHSGSSAIKPAVDFESESVLAVFAGQKPTGGYSIKITSVSLSGSELLVTYHETSPAKGSLNSQVLTAPAHIVKIAKAKADFSSVRFVKD